MSGTFQVSSLGQGQSLPIAVQQGSRATGAVLGADPMPFPFPDHLY